MINIRTKTTIDAAGVANFRELVIRNVRHKAYKTGGDPRLTPCKNFPSTVNDAIDRVRIYGGLSWNVDDKRRIVSCTILSPYADLLGLLTIHGASRCHPEDIWNAAEGCRIALNRAVRSWMRWYGVKIGDDDNEHGSWTFTEEECKR